MLTCWVWIGSLAVEQGQIITAVHIQFSVVGVWRRRRGREDRQPVCQHTCLWSFLVVKQSETHTLCYTKYHVFASEQHTEYLIFKLDKLRNIIEFYYFTTVWESYSWSLTVPVVADGYPLTYCSVAEVVEVRLHKLWEEVPQVVRVWEETKSRMKEKPESPKVAPF